MRISKCVVQTARRPPTDDPDAHDPNAHQSRGRCHFKRAWFGVAHQFLVSGRRVPCGTQPRVKVRVHRPIWDDPGAPQAPCRRARRGWRQGPSSADPPPNLPAGHPGRSRDHASTVSGQAITGSPSSPVVTRTTPIMTETAPRRKKIVTKLRRAVCLMLRDRPGSAGGSLQTLRS
jgi:hypothetical protein